MLKTHKTKKGLVTEVAVAMSGSENSPSWIGREVYPRRPPGMGLGPEISKLGRQEEVVGAWGIRLPILETAR